MNRVLLITGGGRGIGAATAKLAAEAGYAVAISYVREQQAAQHCVDQLRARGAKALAVAADVACEQDVIQLFQSVDEHLGPLTALVNNAGIVAPACPVEALDAARIERMLAVNVTGSLLCAREAVKRMARKNGGHGGAIVNISSAAARLGSPFEYVDYAASKGAIDSMTVGLAKEVAAEGIRVNAVRPGLIHTDIHASGGEPGRVARLQAMVPMGRGGSAEEVAQSILWLLSDAASYTTGALLDVAGGR